MGHIGFEVVTRKTRTISSQGVPLLDRKIRVVGGVTQKIGQPMNVRQRRGFCPAHLLIQQSQGRFSVALRGGRDADETPIDHALNRQLGPLFAQRSGNGLLGIRQLG